MENTSTLLRTADFAAIAHKDQKRKDPEGTPYINHPIGVANLISGLGGDNDLVTLQAALLHDTIEDTHVTYDDIVKEFGDDVAKVVQEVTDDKSLPKATRKKVQIEHAPHLSHKAKTIKEADKLYNIIDLARNPPNNWDFDRIRGYFVWAYKALSLMRGTNKGLEEAIDSFFKSEFTFKGKEYPILPSRDGKILDKQLEEYYERL